jgi:hypothetical protein
MNQDGLGGYFDRMTLLYTQKTWYIWHLDFKIIFKGFFGFANVYFQAINEESSSKAIAKSKDENPIIKLWNQLVKITCCCLSFLVHENC